MKSCLACLLVTLALLASPAGRAADAPAARPSTYLYVLHLVARLHDDQAWSAADKEAVGRHFARLQAATATGRVAFAGRTMEPGPATFGVVVFEAESPDAARKFAEEDPAVVAQVMTVEVHPFALVLERDHGTR